MEKIDARKLSTAEQQLLRNQAIRLRKQGKTYKNISEITGLNPTTISGWWSAYKKEGPQAIKIKKRGRSLGANRTLTPEQEKEIQRAISDKTPNQFKFPFALWNRRAIKDLIHYLYSIKMPIRTVGEYLKRWGYTPQKPLKKAYKQNPKAVQKWLDEEYPAIQKKAKLEKAEIHWGDETGIQNDAYNARGFSPRGKAPVVRLNAKKNRINLMSTITNNGKVRFMLYRETMTSQLLIKFMTRLIKDVPRKVFLVLDNLRVHHSKKVAQWLDANREYIEVFYLPPYAPEYNPDEYLNGDLKQRIRSGLPARSQKDLACKTRSFMKTLQRRYFHNILVAF